MRRIGTVVSEVGHASSPAPAGDRGRCADRHALEAGPEGARSGPERAYRGDLITFAAHHGEEIGELTAVPVRAFLAGLAELSPASRKRKRAAVASFTKWAHPGADGADDRPDHGPGVTLR
ncbi:site-specific integrase [Nonomuraea sp. NPDC004297]